MKHFYLIANPSKEHTGEMRERIANRLESRGADCRFLDENTAGGGAVPLARLVPEDTECVITLGGDGTLLRAARNLLPRSIPLLGINMGTLGYLTQVSGNELDDALFDALLEDSFRLERRMMLEGSVGPADGDGVRQRGIALNEIVLARSGGMQPIRFRVYVNGSILNEYTADGMIAATPTGSTAYNLSAGGPIVTPGAELIVLTPVCSHALNSSSIVLAGQDRVEIRVAGGFGKRRQMAVFDGDLAMELDGETSLRIARSEYSATFVRLKEVSFLDTLRSKMAKV